MGKTDRRNALSNGAATAILPAIWIAAMLGAAPALAQDAPGSSAAAPGASDDIIIVTGSRIAAQRIDTTNPIASVSAENIANSGVTNLTELLSQSPALFNSVGSYDAAGSNAAFGATGVNLLNLRNLGTNRTLVLVNGRRHIAGISGEAAVDINTIPLALIERVDVLTGGVSAIYGADGVSGVVNFVLKKNFEGLDLRGQRGISTYGDAPSTYLSATAGQNFADDRGNFTVSYEYRREGRLAAAKRKSGRPGAERLVRNPDDIPDDPNIPDNVFLRNIRYANSSTDGAVYVSLAPFLDPTSPPDFRGGGQVYDGGRFLPESGFLTEGGSSTPTNAYQGDLQAQSQSHNVNLMANFEFSPAFDLFLEAKYVKSKSFSVSQPSFLTGNFIQADNPFIPQAIRDAIAPGNFALLGLPDGVLMLRDNFDMGTRDERLNRDLFRGVIGLRGEIGDHARYEVSYTYGRNKTRFKSENYRLEDRFFAALDAVDEGQFLTGTPNGRIRCRADLTGNPIDIFNYGNSGQTFTPGASSGCAPINLFGENVLNQAALDFINVDLENRFTLTQNVVNGYASGDFGGLFTLPGGPVGFALGGEYRKERSSFRPDPIATTATDYDDQDSVLADLALLAPESGGFHVWEAFAELRAPILSDAPFAHRLEVGAALRLSDYSTIGRTTTWKVDGLWSPVRDITLRGSWSEAVRAPNITEQFAPTTGGFSFLSDPCSPLNIDNGTQFRAANCEALISGLGVNFDDFDFDSSPQAAANLPGRVTGNRGLREETARTWTAGAVFRPGFVPRLSISVDWYDIRLRNAINTATLEETAQFCVDSPTLDNVFCDNITRSTETGYVVDYILRPENVAFFETAGADVEVNYVVPVGKGNVSLSGRVGYLDKLKFLPANGGIVDNDRGEVGAPKWVGTADVTWDLGKFQVNYGLNYVGKQRRFEYNETENDPDIVDPRYLYHRAGVTHDIRFEWLVNDGQFRFFAGANNFTNEQPGRGSQNTPVGFMGRYFYAGARIRTDAIGF